MLAILASVFLVYLGGAVAPGPLLAITLAGSCRSPRAGLGVALGHISVEIPLILLLFFGVSPLFASGGAQLAVSILGGGLMVGLGLTMFRRQSALLDTTANLKYSTFALGAITSSLSPMFWLWWATIGAMFLTRLHDFGLAGLLGFILAAELPDLAWYSATSVVAYRTRTVLGGRLRRWLFTASSLLVMGFGAYFFISGLARLT